MLNRALNFCVKKQGNVLLRQMSGISAGATVISPRHYGNNFRAPKVDHKLNLELTNPHPNDDSIVFNSEDHTCKYVNYIYLLLCSDNSLQHL